MTFLFDARLFTLPLLKLKLSNRLGQPVPTRERLLRPVCGSNAYNPPSGCIRRSSLSLLMATWSSTYRPGASSSAGLQAPTSYPRLKYATTIGNVDAVPLCSPSMFAERVCGIYRSQLLLFPRKLLAKIKFSISQFCALRLRVFTNDLRITEVSCVGRSRTCGRSCRFIFRRRGTDQLRRFYWRHGYVSGRD